jgi:two-component system NtrC family sensor kinase
MSPTGNPRRAWLGRGAFVALLLAVYAGLATCFQVVLRTDVVYNHFAYIPLVVAGIWWGRRAALLVIPLAVTLLSFRVLGMAEGPLWSDLARVGFFGAVAFVIGGLTERVWAGQRAVRQSEEKYRLLIEGSLAGVFVCSDDRILFVNSRLARMLDCRAEQMVGMSIWDIVMAEHRPQVRELLQKQAAGESADLMCECRFVRSDGTPLWVEIASCPTLYEGRPAVMLNAYDTTERREADRRRRELFDLTRRQEEQLVHSTRLAELGEMAATIAHELNQPLTGIKNYARNAAYMIEQDAGSTNEVKENLDLISAQVDRAARIIGQMRELTRRTAHTPAPMDVNASVRETVEFLMPQFRLSNVGVTLELSEGLPLVHGDKVRLEQVFLNLLANARQALEEQPVRRLSVRSYLDREKSCPVTVEVEDSGVGFAAEDRERLFRPFYSTKKAGHGTGLGLSISLSIVRDHQGEIEAVGAPGKGAKFTVRLPAAVAREQREEGNGSSG